MKNFSIIFSLLVLSVALIGCETKGKTETISINKSTKKTSQKDTSAYHRYSWLSSYTSENMLVNRIEAPEGYERINATKGSFTDWLRHLPLKPGTPQVKLYNGELKYNQSAQFAVLDIDAGKEDLQQCADAVIRLKAEYHFSKKENSKVHFKFTSGDVAEYSKWLEGYRAVVKNNKVSWVKSAQRDLSYKNFKAYLRQVFMYAGTSSLSKEMQPIELKQMQAGDVFIHGGFPGHAVIVLDLVENKTTGKKFFLIAQSYMPAQDIHILKNSNANNSPWSTLR